MARKVLITIFFLAVLGYCLKQIFDGLWILPQAFNIGPVTIRFYGLIMAFAVGVGFYFAKKRAVKFGIDPKTADDLMFWVIVGGFIGARIYHVLTSLAYYQHNLIDILKVWNGGLSIFGAILGGLIVIQLLAKSYKLKAISLLDWLVPSVILGQIIGRFGNLFNYEAFGYPTNLPWKMFVPLNFRPEPYEKFNYFHPFFLYEILGNLIILFLLVKIIEPKFNKKSSSGYVGFFYFLLYNILRFGLEFIRIDSVFIGNIRLNILVSLILVFLSAIIIFSRIDKNDKIDQISVQ